MRHTYIVTYDICDPKRLRKVYKTMYGYGEHIQLSVFQCDLNEMALVMMKSDLEDIINHREDQILLIHLGPLGGRFTERIKSIGKPYRHEIPDAIIV